MRPMVLTRRSNGSRLLCPSLSRRSSGRPSTRLTPSSARRPRQSAELNCPRPGTRQVRAVPSAAVWSEARWAAEWWVGPSWWSPQLLWGRLLLRSSPQWTAPRLRPARSCLHLTLMWRMTSRSPTAAPSSSSTARCDSHQTDRQHRHYVAELHHYGGPPLLVPIRLRVRPRHWPNLRSPRGWPGSVGWHPPPQRGRHLAHLPTGTVMSEFRVL